jgi:hypothetical protein
MRVSRFSCRIKEKIMTLVNKLTEMREASAAKFPPEIKEKMHRATEELRNSGIMEKALNVGDKMPSFNLPNTKGEMVSSDDLLKNGNLVVTFYRGVW